MIIFASIRELSLKLPCTAKEIDERNIRRQFHLHAHHSQEDTLLSPSHLAGAGAGAATVLLYCLALLEMKTSPPPP